MKLRVRIDTRECPNFIRVTPSAYKVFSPRDDSFAGSDAANRV